MKIFLIQLHFIAIGFSLVKSDCSFSNFANNYQPMFFQKIHSQIFFVPVKNNTIYIPDDGSVQAYCSKGFRSFDVESGWSVKSIGSQIKEITIDCENLNNYANIEDKRFILNINLQCKKPTISLHSVRTYMCGHNDNALIMNLEYHSQKLALAEICYDFEAMELKYIYHKAARRSPILSQEKNNSIVAAEVENPVELISNSLSISDEEIKSQIKALFGSVAGAVEYVYDHLVPLDSFDPFVTDSMETATYLTKILWWKPLKEGNWRLFLDLLKKHSPQNNYSIITGVSGAVTYYQKNCGEFKYLKFEANGLIKTAPKLIWSYLILNTQQYQDLNNSTNYKRKVESFVAIAYNTPFFDKITPYNICKNDICGRIPWLRNLLESQKRLTFGYIICCTPEEAKLYIPEIPKDITNLGQLIPDARETTSNEPEYSESDEDD